MKFGFYVRNGGRRIATGVRFQLQKIEYKERDGDLVTVAEHAYELALYNATDKARGVEVTSLVPKGKALVYLAEWREDWDVIFPAIGGTPDYYESICAAGVEYRFSVVAFDDRGYCAEETITIETPKPRPKKASEKASSTPA